MFHSEFILNFIARMTAAKKGFLVCFHLKKEIFQAKRAIDRCLHEIETSIKLLCAFCCVKVPTENPKS